MSENIRDWHICIVWQYTVALGIFWLNTIDRLLILCEIYFCSIYIQLSVFSCYL